MDLDVPYGDGPPCIIDHDPPSCVGTLRRPKGGSLRRTLQEVFSVGLGLVARRFLFRDSPALTTAPTVHCCISSRGARKALRGLCVYIGEVFPFETKTRHRCGEFLVWDDGGIMLGTVIPNAPLERGGN